MLMKAFSNGHCQAKLSLLCDDTQMKVAPQHLSKCRSNPPLCLQNDSNATLSSPAVLTMVRLLFGFATFCATASLRAMPEAQRIDECQPGGKLLSCEWVRPPSQFLHCFASNSWSALGAALLLSGFDAPLAATGQEQALLSHPWLLRIGLTLCEAAAPVIVACVLWPALLEAGPGKKGLLKLWPILMAHNGSAIVALLESALLGSAPRRASSAAFPITHGRLSPVFQWWVAAPLLAAAMRRAVPEGQCGSLCPLDTSRGRWWRLSGAGRGRPRARGLAISALTLRVLGHLCCLSLQRQ